MPGDKIKKLKNRICELENKVNKLEDEIGELELVIETTQTSLVYYRKQYLLWKQKCKDMQYERM